jgi:hypothetical protein
VRSNPSRKGDSIPNQPKHAARKDTTTAANPAPEPARSDAITTAVERHLMPHQMLRAQEFLRQRGIKYE